MPVRTPRIFVYVIACMLMGMSAAAERSVTSWGALSPPPAAIEDPFAKLSFEQLEALKEILRFESYKGTSSRGTTLEDVQHLRSKLSRDGLDVDWLFKQRENIIAEREAQATEVNPELIGKEIRLPGYVLPLEFDGQKVISFLLVPYAGACIHTPPPPPNQMVHVNYPKGLEITGLFTPVWIEGTMNAEFSVQDVGYSDGGSRVEVGYEMSPEKVYLY